MRYLTIILSLITILLAGCEKENTVTLGVLKNDPRPDGLSASQESAKLVVNGRPWVYEGTMDIRAEFYDSYFLTIYINTGAPKMSLALVINKSEIEEKIYQLEPTSEEGSASATIYYSFPDETPCSYRFNHILDGKLTITEFNMETAVCRGSFDFTAYSQYCDTLKITGGQFASTLHY